MVNLSQQILQNGNMIRSKILIIGIALFLWRCGENKDKSQVQVKDGIDTTYYESGYVKTVGTYNDGIKTGWHYDYYDSTKEQIKGASFYGVNNEGDSEIEKLVIYSKDGVKSYEFDYINNPFLLNAPDTVFQGDTLTLRLSFKNPKYAMIRAYTGNIDPLVGVINGPVEHFLGENNQVVIKKIINQSGKHTLRGHLINSTIEPVSYEDHVYGIEKGEITYFEHEYYAVPN